MEKTRGRRVPKAAIAVITAAVVVSILMTVFGVWSGIFSCAGLNSSVGGENTLTASFFSVGCGDCCLLASGGKTLLIDSGEKTNCDSAVHCLKKNGIDKIDVALITHFDSDHCNNFLNVLDKAEVKMLVTSSALNDNELSEQIISAAKEKGTAVEYKKTGDTISLGNMKVTVLSPNKKYRGDNDNSLAVKVEAFGHSMLFMGDASEAVEQDLLESGVNLKCDVLLSAHHGSELSSSEKFLEAAQPQYAVVSVGVNPYGLPSVETISRLENCGAKVVRTDESGCITFYITEDEIKVESEYHRR